MTAYRQAVQPLNAYVSVWPQHRRIGPLLETFQLLEPDLPFDQRRDSIRFGVLVPASIFDWVYRSSEPA
jgi:hypothetical protein